MRSRRVDFVGTLVSTLSGILVLVGAACGRVSEDKIRAWKTEPGGIDQLVAVLKDAGVEPRLRAAATAALVEAGAGVRMTMALGSLPIEERAAILPAAVPLVASALGHADAAIAWDAREALLGMREQATTSGPRAAIDAALLPALERDLRAGRISSGRRTLAEILTALGADSTPTLSSVLEADAAPFSPAWEVLAKVGDVSAKEKGGAALARRARAMTSPPVEIWAALGALGGVEAIKLLQERIETGAPEVAVPAAEALAKMKRNPALLPFALKIAGQKTPAPPPAVRDRMLELVTTVGGVEAREGLTAIIGREADPEFRYRLFAAALKVSGSVAVLPALEAFPETGRYTIEEMHKNLSDPIYALGFDNRESLYKALKSKSKFARMAAVLAFEKTGTDGDVPKLADLANDRATLSGFPAGRTIGAEAKRIIAELKKMAAPAPK